MKRKNQSLSHNISHPHNFDIPNGDFNNIPPYSSQRLTVSSPGPSHRQQPNFYSPLNQLQQVTQPMQHMPPYHPSITAFFQNPAWNGNSRQIQNNRINHYEYEPPPPISPLSMPHMSHGRGAQRNSFQNQGSARGSRARGGGKSKPGNNGGSIVHSNQNNYFMHYSPAPSVEQMVLDSPFNDNASNALVAAMHMQSHCFTTKEWNAQDAIRAYNFDQEFSALLEMQMLRIRFPVPELTHGVVRAFLPYIPAVQIHLPSAPR